MRRVASVGCAVSTSCERDPPLELLRRDALEPGDRVVERLRGHPLLELVGAEPAHTVMLLGDVRELEVQPEGPQHARLALERQRLHRLLELLVWRPGARLACERPHPLDVREQRLALLLDEDAPEQVAEQADVPAERGISGLGRCHASSVGWNRRKTAQSGACSGRAAASFEPWVGHSSTRSGTAISCSATRACPSLLYVDLHLVHEVTSPQAFEGLRLAGRAVRRPDLTLATMDHNVVTGDDTPMDELSAQQLEALQGQLRGVRRPALRDRQRARGHRPRDRPGARLSRSRA